MMLTGLLLALCLTGAVAQTTQSQYTQSPFSCFLEAVTQQQNNNQDCNERFGEVVENGNINFDNVEEYCSTYCAVQFNKTLMETCQLSFIEGLCSRDNSELCLAQNQPGGGTEIGNMLGQIINGPCLNVNCSDSTCYSAVQNLTCCIDGVSKVSEIIGLNIGNALLPSDCAAPACMVTLGGAASTLVAIPLTIMVALSLILSATM